MSWLKPIIGIAGPRGEKGEKGEKGDRGIQGLTGPAGPQADFNNLRFTIENDGHLYVEDLTNKEE